MDKLKELREQLEAAGKEARAAIEKNDKDAMTRSMAKVEEIRGKLAALEELRSVETAMAAMPKPVEQPAESGWGSVRKQLLAAVESGKRSSIDISGIERRAITSNGAGANTAPGIIRTIVDGGKLRSKVSLFLGKNAVTTVPVWAPSVAMPVGSVPGATGTASDSTAVLTGDPLTLKAWYSTIAISMGALMSTDIEAELPAIFSEAFAGSIDKAILVGAGSGSDMLGTLIASASGVTTSQDITCTSGAAAAPNWADYLDLALQLLALGGDVNSLAIVVHPTIFKAALGAAASGYDPMKNEYLLKGTILGIPVILSSYALTTLTAGSYVAIGGYFKHYALALAQEIHIDQIKTVGSDNVTFQAFMYMQGKPLVGSSFRRLKTAAA